MNTDHNPPLDSQSDPFEGSRRESNRLDEGQLDAALHLLRSVRPRAGLEARMHAAIAERSAAAARGQLHTSRSWRVFWLPASATLAALLLLAVSIQRRDMHHVPPSAVANQRPPANDPATAHRATNLSVLRPAAHAPTATVGQRRAAPETADLAEPPASFPAPPLPLTRQEILLLRVAHQADPKELAPLTPTRREADTNIEIAEFHAFFPPDHKEIPQ